MFCKKENFCQAAISANRKGKNHATDERKIDERRFFIVSHCRRRCRGAGSGARTSMGITVVAGMTTATLFGIFIIPMLFIIIETLGPGLFTNRKKNHD